MILQYRDSSHLADQIRLLHLTSEVPVILVVDEQHCHLAESTYGGSDVDVIVRSTNLEFRLSESLQSTGPVLRCVEEMEYSTVGPRQLELGDSILLATDGITETCNSQVKLFGRGRMLNCIRRHHEESALITLDRLFG